MVLLCRLSDTAKERWRSEKNYVEVLEKNSRIKDETGEDKLYSVFLDEVEKQLRAM